MTHPELILKLIEQLIAEREKNIKLQAELEEYKKGKDQTCHTQSGGKVFTGFLIFLVLKKQCIYGYTTSKQYTHPELRYIV